MNGEVDVLKDKEAMATVGVKHLDAARKFYGDTLGLPENPSKEAGALVFKSGHSTLLVYESQYAGTNQATAATWVVGGELDAIVQALRTKGVRFEHYDLPDTRREGDIHVSGATRVAWCKDPDGNILSFVNG